MNEERQNPQDDYEKRFELFWQERDTLLKRSQANSENLDKAIRTLSTATLGFTLAFRDKIVDPVNVIHLWPLYVSWALLVLAILSTLNSYISSYMAINRQMEINHRYYLEYDREAMHAKNRFAQITNWLIYSSVVFYSAALLFIVLFVVLNKV